MGRCLIKLRCRLTLINVLNNKSDSMMNRISIGYASVRNESISIQFRRWSVRIQLHYRVIKGRLKTLVPLKNISNTFVYLAVNSNKTN